MEQHDRADIGGGIDTRNSGKAPSLQRFTHSLLACAFTTSVFTTTAIWATSVHAADVATIATSRTAYNIPPGPLEGALNRYGREAGILLSYPTELTAGRRSQGLAGTYSVQEALPLLLAGTGLAAVAQPGDGWTLVNVQTSSQAEPGKELPLVSVTAERTGSFKSNVVQVGAFRDMAPLDVPQTSNVITREVLDAQATTSLFGALRNTAGITRTQLSGSTYDNVAIRGILVENRGNYRLNGSLPIINLIDIPLENKERVEVLKGASSLYYGFVPPSGIVNMVTKRAGNNPVTNLGLMGNQYGGANAHLDVGRRFGSQQQFGARVNLLKGREDIGINNYSGDRMLASGAFDWRVSVVIGPVPQIAPKKHVALRMWQSGMRCHGRPE
ncbi:TonB-dependent siderophore receptor [Candidatus Nitrotoga arctica]|uniref:Secretin/TonB short N-terminal domain-containing protein n=1 Tax=Candidatus Nitrotoga arctica TaxID=453162 RepID=A0ABN8AR79_9PROT|nr:TonB-dependent receptor [Candidatus Nitrotoga arctica]CAG9933233.1 protein of unknown function [Candidatus Nitrotoga arctica]